MGWRQTAGCSPSGRREPARDRGCDVSIGQDWSGYCECAGGVQRSRVTCKVGSHKPFSCDAACADVPPAPAVNSTVLRLSNGFSRVDVDVRRTRPATVAARMRCQLSV